MLVVYVPVYPEFPGCLESPEYLGCLLSIAQHFLGVLAIGNDVYAGLLWPFINSQSALPFGRFASDRRNTCRRDATVAG